MEDYYTLTTMRGAKTLMLVATLSLAFHAHAASDSGPYKAIVERNVFGLKPPPRPEDNPPPPPPPSKVILTGILTFGSKRALVTIAVPGKPKPENFILTEGQREGDVEVVQIDEKAGTVKITNHGVEQTLDFKTDGAKTQPVANPIPVPQPGIVLPQNQPAIPPPGGLPPPSPRIIPTRSMRVPPLPGANSENP